MVSLSLFPQELLLYIDKLCFIMCGRFGSIKLASYLSFTIPGQTELGLACGLGGVSGQYN